MKRNLFLKTNLIFLFMFFSHSCGQTQTTSHHLSQKTKPSQTSSISQNKNIYPIQLECDGKIILPQETLLFEDFSLRKAVAVPQKTIRIVSIDGKGHSLLQYIKIENNSVFRIKESFMEEKIYPNSPETFLIEFSPSTQGEFHTQIRITYDQNKYYDFYLKGKATF